MVRMSFMNEEPLQTCDVRALAGLQFQWHSLCPCSSGLDGLSAFWWLVSVLMSCSSPCCFRVEGIPASCHWSRLRLGRLPAFYSCGREWLPMVLASLGMTPQGLGSPFLFPHGHWHGQKWECAYLWPKLGELGGQIAAHHLLLNAGIQACSKEEGITMLLIQSRGLHLIFLQFLVCWMILSGALLPMKQLCFFVTV